MKKRIAPVLEIEVDITQPTRCVPDCPFFYNPGLGFKCRLFNKRLRIVNAKNFPLTLYYIHRCQQCRAAEVK